jgi:hypothetical protein
LDSESIAGLVAGTSSVGSGGAMTTYLAFVLRSAVTIATLTVLLLIVTVSATAKVGLYL